MNRRKSNQKANSLRANRGNSRNKNSGFHDIPQRNLTIKNSKVFRFRAGTTLNEQIIAPNNMRGIFGLMATTTNNLQPMCKSLRVKRITIHTPPASTGNYSSCGVRWIGVYGEHVLVSDTSINISRPAFITSTPPANSLASFWRTTSDSDGFMALSVPQNSIIDLEVEWIIFDGANNVTSFLASAPLPLYSIVYGYLDGLNQTLAPIGLATYS